MGKLMRQNMNWKENEVHPQEQKYLFLLHSNNFKLCCRHEVCKQLGQHSTPKHGSKKWTLHLPLQIHFKSTFRT